MERQVRTRGEAVSFLFGKGEPFARLLEGVYEGWTGEYHSVWSEGELWFVDDSELLDPPTSGKLLW